MSGTFKSVTYNFSTLLGRASFPDYTAKTISVPEFQRGYSWDKSHVSTFWQDVIQYHESEKAETYFLGPIVILPETETVKILDGQQRLATATIMLGVMREMAEYYGGKEGAELARDIHRDYIIMDDDEDEYALTLNELDWQFFRDYVQAKDPDVDLSPKLRSHRLIKQAKDFIWDSMDEHYIEDEGSEFIEKLKQLKKDFVQNVKLVCIEVNSEEEAYQIFETLNDRGLRLSVPDLLLNFLMYAAKNDSQRTKIRAGWNSITEMMRNRKISDFLRHVWVSEYGDVKKQGLYREIRSWINNNSITSLGFVQNIHKRCESYTNIVDHKEAGDAEVHLEALLKSLGSTRTLPLLLSGYDCLTPQDFTKLTKYSLALVVRHSLIANLNPSHLEDTFYFNARYIRQLKNEGRTSSSILSTIKNNFNKINPSKNELKDKISDVFLKKEQAKYIIKEIAHFKESSSHVFDFSKNVTLEHVYPQNASKSNWANKDELDPYVWHIGNLTILEKSLNKKAGNSSFSSKQEVYESSEIKLTGELTKYKSWNEEAVLKRAESLVKTIDSIWTIP